MASSMLSRVAQLSSWAPAKGQLSTFLSGQITPSKLFPGGLRDDEVHENGHLFKMINPADSFPAQSLSQLCPACDSILRDYSSLWKETSAPFLSLSPFLPLLATLDLAAVPGGGVGLGDGRRVERHSLAFALSGSIHALPRTRGRRVAQERTRSGRDRTAESRSGKKPQRSASATSPDVVHFARARGAVKIQ